MYVICIPNCIEIFECQVPTRPQVQSKRYPHKHFVKLKTNYVC